MIRKHILSLTVITCTFSAIFLPAGCNRHAGEDYTLVWQDEFDYNGLPDSNRWPFDKRFHLLLNIAVGGTWGGRHGIDDSVFPQSMVVDWVRVYQKK